MFIISYVYLKPLQNSTVDVANIVITINETDDIKKARELADKQVKERGSVKGFKLAIEPVILEEK